MKKVNFKKVYMALAVTMTFLFFGVAFVNAQSNASVVGVATSPPPAGSITASLLALPQGNFVSVDEAVLLVEAELQEIKVQTQAPGLPQSAINALMKKATFYTLILSNLKSGMGVPQAIVRAAVNVVPDIVTESVSQGLKQEATTLLKV